MIILISHVENDFCMFKIVLEEFIIDIIKKSVNIKIFRFK